jgi:hypothetical protein
MRKALIFCLCFFLATAAPAVQRAVAVDNALVLATLSSQDVTRIAVEGDRIQHIIGVKGAYTLEEDTEAGEVYIQPSPLYQHRAFTVLLRTEQGHHVTVLFNPLAVPSNTLLLRFRAQENMP